MNVLSLFDGMSCGQQALERAEFDITKYYASEIDKYAMQVTMDNYPSTIQLGSVVNVDVTKLDKIDLLLGGSPCQSFSFAGKRKGMSTKCETEILTLNYYLELKEQGFEFEGQSYLFWEYMRALTDIRKINPDVKFLLENVEMGEKWEKVLSKAIGVNGIHINSALVSAQNRKRIYWTNIGMEPAGLFGDMQSIIQQPRDKGILLKDILESEVDEKYFLSEKMEKWINKHALKRNVEVKKLDGFQKSCTLTSSALVKQNLSTDYIVALRGRNQENPNDRRKGIDLVQTLEPRTDNKTNCLTSVQKDNLVIKLNPSKESGGKQPYQQNRVYDVNGISPALQAQLSIGSNYIIFGDGYEQGNRAYFENGKSGTLDTKPGRQKTILNPSRIRRLTPTECERLQTVKDGYTSMVSDTQRYKMLGNGWTIDVIWHILSYLKD